MMKQIIAILGLLSASAYTGAACTCLGSRPFCEAPPSNSQSADQAVFLGTVESADPIAGFKRERLIRLRVDELFVGSPGSVFEFRGGSGTCCDCSLPFKTGEQYLIAAYRWQDRWIADTCSGSAHIGTRHGQRELRALRAWKAGRHTQGSIDGAVLDSTNRFDGAFLNGPPPPGFKVHLSGPAIERETITDPSGHFNFDNLPAARYRLALSAPGWFPSRSTEGLARDVDLTQQSCGSASFPLRQAQATVRGRIRRQDGKPPRWVQIEAFRVPLLPQDSRVPSGRTNEEGEFAIEELEPGEYIFGVHIYPKPAGFFTPSFYPGYPDADRAQRFRVERGETVELAPWLLPVH